MDETHYLQRELYELVQRDPRIFEFLMSGSLDGVWYWDLENPEHEWMSPELWRVFGIDPDTREHKPSEWQDLIDPDDLQFALDNFHAHCADPNHPYDQVVRYRHADGSTVWVRCRGLAIRDENGKPIRMLGAHNELTAEKKAEFELEERVEKLELIRQRLGEANIRFSRANRALAAKNDELEGFIRTVAHDVRNPLNGVSMLLGEVFDELPEQLRGEFEDSFERVHATTARTVELLNSLLRFATTDANRAVFSVVHLDTIIHDVRDDLCQMIDDTSAEVTASALPVVRADRTLMRQLIENLVSNAIKYSGNGATPAVHVSSARAAEAWRVEVHDNGPGIPEEARDRVFQLFERCGRDDGEGVGVGLALCQRIVAVHGGEIGVEPSPEGGSVFWFTLPDYAARDAG